MELNARMTIATIFSVICVLLICVIPVNFWIEHRRAPVSFTIYMDALIELSTVIFWCADESSEMIMVQVDSLEKAKRLCEIFKVNVTYKQIENLDRDESYEVTIRWKKGSN
jgi:hypothetical protein